MRVASRLPAMGEAAGGLPFAFPSVRSAYGQLSAEDIGQDFIDYVPGEADEYRVGIQVVR